MVARVAAPPRVIVGLRENTQPDGKTAAAPPEGHRGRNSS